MREKILLTLGECTDEDEFVLPDLAVPKLEALFTASQSKLKTESDARLELIKRMLEKMEQMQAETAAIREALQEASPLLAERLTYCTCQSEYNKVQRVIEIVDTALKGGK